MSAVTARRLLHRRTETERDFTRQRAPFVLAEICQTFCFRGFIRTRARTTVRIHISMVPDTNKPSAAHKTCGVRYEEEAKSPHLLEGNCYVAVRYGTAGDALAGDETPTSLTAMSVLSVWPPAPSYPARRLRQDRSHHPPLGPSSLGQGPRRTCHLVYVGIPSHQVDRVPKYDTARGREGGSTWSDSVHDIGPQ
jgi:hypothetical protein